MGNKKANDLGIGQFLENVQTNKPDMEKTKETRFSDQESQELEKEEQVIQNRDNTIVSPVIRNVYMTPETLFRLENVKKMLNDSRKKGDKIVSLANLMNDILVEYLNANYPQTKDLYRLIESMKK